MIITDYLYDVIDRIFSFTENEHQFHVGVTNASDSVTYGWFEGKAPGSDTWTVIQQPATIPSAGMEMIFTGKKYTWYGYTIRFGAGDGPTSSNKAYSNEVEVTLDDTSWTFSCLSDSSNYSNFDTIVPVYDSYLPECSSRHAKYTYSIDMYPNTIATAWQVSLTNSIEASIDGKNWMVASSGTWLTWDEWPAYFCESGKTNKTSANRIGYLRGKEVAVYLDENWSEVKTITRYSPVVKFHRVPLPILEYPKDSYINGAIRTSVSDLNVLTNWNVIPEKEKWYVSHPTKGFVSLCTNTGTHGLSTTPEDLVDGVSGITLGELKSGTLCFVGEYGHDLYDNPHQEIWGPMLPIHQGVISIASSINSISASSSNSIKFTMKHCWMNTGKARVSITGTKRTGGTEYISGTTISTYFPTSPTAATGYYAYSTWNTSVEEDYDDEPCMSITFTMTDETKATLISTYSQLWFQIAELDAADETAVSDTAFATKTIYCDNSSAEVAEEPKSKKPKKTKEPVETEK